MILKAFTVYDMKTEAYLRPFFALTEGEAIRMFSDAVNTAGNQFNAHAEDFILYGIGKFDDSLGQLDKEPQENLGSALRYIKQVQNGPPEQPSISDEPPVLTDPQGGNSPIVL